MAVPMINGKQRTDPCPHCNGEGQVPHVCKTEHLLTVEEIYKSDPSPGHSTSLYIKACKRCGQMWKVRYQYDPGTGSDCIWIKPGEEERGYKFTEAEARQLFDKARLVLLGLPPNDE